MEGFSRKKAEGNGEEKSPEQLAEAMTKRESLAEKKRQAAFAATWAELEKRFPTTLENTFEANGHSFELVTAEDCMVAYAQQLREEVAKLHQENIKKEDYYEEKATAKLLELFRAHERLVSLFAELRSYYPTAAENAAAKLPSLSDSIAHAEELFKEMKK